MTQIPMVFGIAALLVFGAYSGANAGHFADSAQDAAAAKIDGRVIDANNAFAFDLLGKTCAAGEGKNIFFSPLSVSIALAMTYNGAAGKTAGAMSKVLRYSGIEIADLNQALKELDDAMAKENEGLRLTIANSLWGNLGVGFSDDFFKVNRRYYNAEISVLDFASPEALGTINGWVDKNTDGLIDKIIDAIPPEAVLYLINAIYFKGTWQTEFDPKRTNDFEFNTAEGGTESVQMMRQSASYQYAEEMGAQAVRLPYDGNRFAMYVFLPAPESSIDTFLDGFDEILWKAWTEKLTKAKGDVYLPRFKIEYECTLNGALKDMGMEIAFDPSKADFSKIASSSHGGGMLSISDVKHKAVVEVNEEGTEAAAVTSVEIKATSASPEERFTFIANRPFLLAICDDATGSIIFMGVIHLPSF